MSTSGVSTTVNDKKSNWVEPSIYICGWYIFSLSIVVYNKWMFGSSLDFHFPIIITSFHQLCLFCLSAFVLWKWPKYRPQVNQSISNSFWSSIKMSWISYLKKIVPCGLASAGDIGLSNYSFTLVSLSVYTMVKTSSLAFVLLFGLLFGLEKFKWTLLFIVALMSLSVMMMVYPQNSTHQTTNSDTTSPLGICLVLLASMMSGLRWSFTQILLKHNDYTPNPFSTIFYISPAMFSALLLIGLGVEGWPQFISAPIWESKGTLTTIGLLLIPGFLAFMMTVFEFKLLSVAQVTTLSVAGIFKELLTILLSAVIFGDRLSLLNWAGLSLTFLDILWYNYFRQNSQEYSPLVDEEIEMAQVEPKEKIK